MSLWMHVLGWIILAVNSLCLLRLGILPMVFFGRNYKLYHKIFWVSLFVTIILSMSEIMILRMLLSIEVEK